MIPAVSRMTTSIAAGVVGVALPLSLWMRPITIAEGSLTVETAILASTGVYWLFTRKTHRLQSPAIATA